eukprot:jgi/Botrbrau1/3989/Bobra.0016s0002.1
MHAANPHLGDRPTIQTPVSNATQYSTVQTQVSLQLVCGTCRYSRSADKGQYSCTHIKGSRCGRAKCSTGCIGSLTSEVQ